MGMTVHVGHRTDHLADGLADLLAEPGPDPFAEDVVVVPAKGVERWLTQRLSHRLGAQPGREDGVCAGVRFLNPSCLVTLLTGTEAEDPWHPDRLVWSVLRVVDAGLDEPWCRPLARHLGRDHEGLEGDLRADRRWSVARRIAGLFASYAGQRPRLLDDWAAGEDLDGAGSPLDADLRWQAELWRRVAAQVGAPSPTVRHRDTLVAIAAGSTLPLPDRLSLFGHTRLTSTEVDLLAAVGQVGQVHLWLPTASPAAWRRLELATPATASEPVRRRDDRAAALVRHPLLATLGRDSRELQHSLARLRARTASVLADEPAPGERLLGWLQHDLRTDTVPDPSARLARRLVAGDRSVEVHATHGRHRQVEVVRDVVVGALQDDPTLQPRDILVMCPDIEGYAPLVGATFGLGTALAAGHPAHQLRVALADRAPAATNPLLAVATALVAIAGGRASITEVLELAAAPPVRHRFRFTDDELSTASTWAMDAGVRWGLSAPLRSRYRLDQILQNTWSSGLDRLLAGVAMAEGGQLVGQVLPLDDVPSAEIDLAGRLTELVSRVTAAVEAFLGADDVEGWLDGLAAAVASLTSTPPSQQWQVVQFERVVGGLRAAAASSPAAGAPARLRLADLRAMLEDAGQPRPTRASFRTGALTVCTMVPMRSVPHRLVCLMGLQDGSFPRVQASDGDDVLARDPLVGERDLRSEDRQLLLDAVMATTERLVVTYTGVHPVTGQDHPPSVPLGELLDALDATAAEPVRQQVLVRHPLQPFDPRTTTPGALGGSQSFGFDVAALRGALAARQPARTASGVLAAPLQRPPPADLALHELTNLLTGPAQGFLQQRLGVVLPRHPDEPDDSIPLDLDSLEEWQIGDRVVRRLLDGVGAPQVAQAERCRGALPPGALGDRLLQRIGTRATALVQAGGPAREEPARVLEVDIELEPGRRLRGTVGDVRGERVVRVAYSSLGPKLRLAAWVDLLCLSVAYPEHRWSALAIGWDRAAGSPRRCELLALQQDPLAALRDLVELRDLGMCAPLPMPLRTAHAWADAVRVDRDPYRAAQPVWEGTRDDGPPGERALREHVLLYGLDADLAALTTPGSPAGAGTLGEYAVRLWEPLFLHERIGRL